VKRPGVIYEAVLIPDDADGILNQAGAVPTEAEAHRVLDIWTAEGRREPVLINIVLVYGTAGLWQPDS
jgi:hypothetical protein